MDVHGLQNYIKVPKIRNPVFKMSVRPTLSEMGSIDMPTQGHTGGWGN